MKTRCHCNFDIRCSCWWYCLKWGSYLLFTKIKNTGFFFYFSQKKLLLLGNLGIHSFTAVHLPARYSQHVASFSIHKKNKEIIIIIAINKQCFLIMALKHSDIYFTNKTTLIKIVSKKMVNRGNN